MPKNGGCGKRSRRLRYLGSNARGFRARNTPFWWTICQRRRKAGVSVLTQRRPLAPNM